MTMPSRITGGADTHLEVHVAAALDERGGLLGVETFATTTAAAAARATPPGRDQRCPIGTVG